MAKCITLDIIGSTTIMDNYIVSQNHVFLQSYLDTTPYLHMHHLTITRLNLRPGLSSNR